MGFYRKMTGLSTARCGASSFPSTNPVDAIPIGHLQRSDDDEAVCAVKQPFPFPPLRRPLYR